MPRRLVSILVTGIVVLSGCGGSSGDEDAGRAPTATTPQRGEHSPLALPEGVPLEGSGAADAAQLRVVRAWANTLRRGDVAGASALWALPSTVQNATPVLKLRSRKDVRAFNSALPCGAVVTSSSGAARGYIIVRFRLTDRVGGECVTGVGDSARTAVRVRSGKIVDWYRLPDDSDAAASGTES